MATRTAAESAVLECDWTEARRRCVALAVSLLRSREDAEEAVQEALVRGWRHAASCRNKQNPTSWLMTITRRECARLARQRGAAEEIGVEASDGGPGDDPFGAVDSAVDLGEALARLSDEERLLLEMRYLRQLTQPEIASALGLPEGTVKTKLHRARGRARSRLEVKGWKT
jgi:RNA polymerase sigma-70 factor (ECF subfamily)